LSVEVWLKQRWVLDTKLGDEISDGERGRVRSAAVRPNLSLLVDDLVVR